MDPRLGATLIVLTALAAPLSGHAQAASRAGADRATIAPAAPEGAPEPQGSRKKIERLHHEDAGTRIDELRYGGETQSITVQPKSGAPEYQVIPFDGARQRQEIQRDNSVGSGPTGQRVWKVFGF